MAFPTAWPISLRTHRIAPGYPHTRSHHRTRYRTGHSKYTPKPRTQEQVVPKTCLISQCRGQVPRNSRRSEKRMSEGWGRKAGSSIRYVRTGHRVAAYATPVPDIT
eukprot:2473383-Rhodomonas_salina.2